MSCFLAGLLFVCSVFNKLLHCISTGSWVATGTNVLSDFVILIPLQNFFCYIIFHSLICSYSSFGRCYAEPVNLIAVVPLGLIAPCIYMFTWWIWAEYTRNQVNDKMGKRQHNFIGAISWEETYCSKRFLMWLWPLNHKRAKIPRSKHSVMHFVGMSRHVQWGAATNLGCCCTFSPLAKKSGVGTV